MRTLGKRTTARSGMTIIEMALVTALIGVFGGSAILMANMSARAYRTESTSAELVQASRRAFTQISERLRLADAEQVVPLNTSPPLSTSTVDFRANLGWDVAAGAASFGDLERIAFEYDPGDPDDGVDNDGDGLVDEGQVVWTDDVAGTPRRKILCRGVAETLAGEVAGNLLDDNGNGLEDEPGFAITFEGSRATVRITLQRTDPYGTVIEHTFEKTIVLRNTGVANLP